MLLDNNLSNLLRLQQYLQFHLYPVLHLTLLILNQHLLFLSLLQCVLHCLNLETLQDNSILFALKYHNILQINLSNAKKYANVASVKKHRSIQALIFIISSFFYYNIFYTYSYSCKLFFFSYKQHI